VFCRALVFAVIFGRKRTSLLFMKIIDMQMNLLAHR